MKTTVVMSSRSVGSGASALIVISVPPGLRRAGEHLAADRVEHQVGLACRVLDALGLQRDEAVGAQLRDELGRTRLDVGTGQGAGELDDLIDFDLAQVCRHLQNGSGPAQAQHIVRDGDLGEEVGRDRAEISTRQHIVVLGCSGDEDVVELVPT